MIIKSLRKFGPRFLEEYGEGVYVMGEREEKTVLKFHIKGSSDRKIDMLYPYAGSNVNLIIKQFQMTIEEFYEGTEYTVGNDGEFHEKER